MSLRAQNTPSLPVNGAATEFTPYTVTARGPHHAIWSRVVALTNRLGQTVYRTNSFQQLETGLNVKRNGRWQPASPAIEITAEGAQATNAQHQVYFAANANTADAIHLVMPNGQHLRSHCMALAYFDPDSGQNILIAEIQDTIGQLLSNSNQVVYTNAFAADFRADIRYDISHGSFEQNIILREQPPAPGTWNLGPNTRLQIWTEFTDAPVPNLQSRTNHHHHQPLLDQRIDFGSMQMGPGRAYTLGRELDPGQLIPVAKHWQITEGRRFLIEEVPLSALAVQLQKLPPASSNGEANPQSSLRHKFSPSILAAMEKTKNLPARPPAAPAPIRLASDVSRPQPTAHNSQPSLVLDYNIINTDVTDFTFQSDTTYYLSGTVNMYGTTTVEGGAVIKCGPSETGNAVIDGDVNWRTSPYHPAVFTSTNDNSVGVALNADEVPSFSLTTYLSCLEGGTVSNVRFSYAFNAYSGWIDDVEITNCQFIKCSRPISVNTDTTILGLHNVLITIDPTIDTDPLAITVGSDTLAFSAEHLTADLGTANLIEFSDSQLSAISLTNCIIQAANILYCDDCTPPTSPSATVTTNCVYYTSTPVSGVFQTSVCGNYYLADNSPCRNAGTSNIDAAMLVDIGGRTTVPPIVYSYTLVSNLTLFPQAQRDNSSTPDLGYHYDPLDYAFGVVEVVGGYTVNVLPGTAIGCFNTNSIGYGFLIAGNAQFLSRGTPTSLNHITEVNTVQEQADSSSVLPTSGALLDPNFLDATPSPINCQFCDFSVMAQDTQFFFNFYGGSSAPINLRDCQLHGGGMNLYCGAQFTNCLFERVNATVYADLDGESPEPMYMRNNLFWGGYIEIYTDQTASLFQDNFFCGATVMDDCTVNYVGGYNAFYGTGGAHLYVTDGTDKFLMSDPGFEAGPLGNYYLPSGSSLINVGSAAANTLGLYHYTTQTSQTKEGTSTVDIGYHYVALNDSGQPVDTDGDGIPDYLEDANGNGSVDSGETDWQNANDLGLTVVITRPKNNSVIP